MDCQAVLVLSVVESIGQFTFTVIVIFIIYFILFRVYQFCYCQVLPFLNKVLQLLTTNTTVVLIADLCHGFLSVPRSTNPTLMTWSRKVNTALKLNYILFFSAVIP